MRNKREVGRWVGVSVCSIANRVVGTRSSEIKGKLDISFSRKVCWSKCIYECVRVCVCERERERE